MDKVNKTEHFELLKTNPVVISKCDLEVIFKVKLFYYFFQNLNLDKWNIFKLKKQTKKTPEPLERRRSCSCSCSPTSCSPPPPHYRYFSITFNRVSRFSLYFGCIMDLLRLVKMVSPKFDLEIIFEIK